VTCTSGDLQHAVLDEDEMLTVNGIRHNVETKQMQCFLFRAQLKTTPEYRLLLIRSWARVDRIEIQRIKNENCAAAIHYLQPQC